MKLLKKEGKETKKVSDYDDGYEEGHRDGLEDNWSFTEKMETFGSLIDTVIGVTNREEEWRKGYEAGYEAGKQEREENN